MTIKTAESFFPVLVDAVVASQLLRVFLDRNFVFCTSCAVHESPGIKQPIDSSVQMDTHIALQTSTCIYRTGGCITLIPEVH